jgi:predicted permease
MNEWIRDLRYAARGLRRNPGFATVAILTLMLGVGVNTAIFSIVDTVLFRALPYRDADRLVRIVPSSPGVGLRDIGLSVPEMDDLRSSSGVFDEVVAVWPVSANLTGSDQPVRIELLAVSPNYFSMLGVPAQMGRVFGPQDTAGGFAEAAVISDGLWRRAFGGDSSILGRKLRLDNDLYTVVGVLPPGFRHPGRTVANEVEIWATAGFTDLPFSKPTRNIRLVPGAIGRLKAGVTVAQAQARLTSFTSELRQQFPNDYPAAGRWTVDVVSLKDSLVGDVQPLLLVLLAAVGLIVVTASVNIAGLLLARASGRQREIAMRLALGAGRGRLIRQLLAESLLLSLLGGAGGVVAAGLSMDLILRFVPATVPRLQEVSLDGRVLLFALLLSIVTGVLFGLVPALQASRPNLVDAMREGSHGSGHGPRTSWMRSVLIVTEVALVVVLMIGAGLLVRTFAGLLHEHPGFEPAGVVSAGVWLPVPNDPSTDVYARPAARAAFIRQVMTRLRALQGVQQVGMTTALPLTATSGRATLVIDGELARSSADLTSDVTAVSPEYFSLMRASLLRGRFFDEHDDGSGQPVAMVDETTAAHLWPGEPADGKRLKFSAAATAPWLTVVGIVRDIKERGLDRESVPHVYTSIYQRPSRALSLVVRTDLPAPVLERGIREAVQAVDPGLPVFAVRGMNDVLDASLAARRFSAAVVSAFAALGLFLASIGIYGLLAYMVGQRTQEIGIRLALGAPRGLVRAQVLGDGLRLAVIGVAAGVALAAIGAPLMGSVLYGVRARDPLVFVVVPALLMTATLFASYIPAYRATKVDLLVALRG